MIMQRMVLAAKAPIPAGARGRLAVLDAHGDGGFWNQDFQSRMEEERRTPSAVGFCGGF
jgi:hypothetical protein